MTFKFYYSLTFCDSNIQIFPVAENFFNTSSIYMVISVCLEFIYIFTMISIFRVGPRGWSDLPILLFPDKEAFWPSSLCPTWHNLGREKALSRWCISNSFRVPFYSDIALELNQPPAPPMDQQNGDRTSPHCPSYLVTSLLKSGASQD